MDNSTNVTHSSLNQGKEDVTILVNDNPFTIHRGSQTVAAIKAAAGINPTWDLVIVAEGKISTLSDDGRFTIKGDERFIAHAKVGSAS